MGSQSVNAQFHKPAVCFYEKVSVGLYYENTNGVSVVGFIAMNDTSNASK